MNNITRLFWPLSMRRGAWWLLFGGCLIAACHKGNFNHNDLRNFEQVNLVANKAKYGPMLVDPTLQNAWGLAWAPSGIAWVNSNGDHVSELYTGEGAIVRPPVNIPSPTDTIGGVPSGIVFSGGQDSSSQIIRVPTFCLSGRTAYCRVGMAPMGTMPN